jgi:hypothetical protein
VVGFRWSVVGPAVVKQTVEFAGFRFITPLELVAHPRTNSLLYTGEI